MGDESIREIRVVEVDKFRTKPDRSASPLLRFPWRLSSVPPDRWITIYQEEWSRYVDRHGNEGRPAKIDGLFIWVTCGDVEFSSYDTQVRRVVNEANRRYQKEIAAEEARRQAEIDALDRRKRKVFGE